MSRSFCCDASTTVDIIPGRLQGYSLDGVFIFKGIPYALARRFHMPEPAAPWQGVLDATSFGYVCPLLAEEKPASELLVPHMYWPRNEHCQNLNVWTCTLDRNARRPVLVWLHGGGYSAGSAIEQLAYDGSELARRGAVVVTVNPRLNILGYLDLEPFGAEYENSANAGHADLVEALRWVRDNIEAFGGDPDNVTIFGQSGGGEKVQDLMQIPAADGLFARGVIMSGVIKPELTFKGEGDGTVVVNALMAELGLDRVQQLETVPYECLANAWNRVLPKMIACNAYAGNAPKKNGWFLGKPHIDGFTGRAKRTPLMVGSVLGEFAFAPADYDRDALTDAQADEVLRRVFGSRGPEIGDLFQKAYPEKRRVDAAVTDVLFREPSKRLIAAKSRFPEAPTWAYMFSPVFPVQGGKVAWHCSDIPFFFGNTALVPSANMPGVTDELQEKMCSALLAFAETGDPNTAGLPHWAPCSGDGEVTMVFDAVCRAVRGLDDALIAAVDAALPPRRLYETGGEEDIRH